MTVGHSVSWSVTSVAFFAAHPPGGPALAGQTKAGQPQVPETAFEVRSCMVGLSRMGKGI